MRSTIQAQKLNSRQQLRRFIMNLPDSTQPFTAQDFIEFCGKGYTPESLRNALNRSVPSGELFVTEFFYIEGNMQKQKKYSIKKPDHIILGEPIRKSDDAIGLLSNWCAPVRLSDFKVRGVRQYAQVM